MKLNKPTLIIDKQKAVNNILKMSEKASDQQLTFRPHFKTHQNHEVGSWFWEAGVRKITVSSFDMAQFFIEDGWDDITVAFSVNIHEINKIQELSEKISLNLVLEDESVIEFLDSKLTEKVGVYVEINTGYNRAGLDRGNIEQISALLIKLETSRKLLFKGFLTFAGHSYYAKGEDEILEVHQRYMRDMISLKKEFGRQYPSLELSIGDTPTCSVAKDFSEIDEMRPGNFVYYDLMQLLIGSCKKEQVAAVVACPVVAIHRKRREIVIFGGAVHFSKEPVSTPERGAYYGEVVELTNTGWSLGETGAYLSWMSQEHGIIKAPESFIERIKVGDFIGVIPSHSCLTANLMKDSTLIINTNTHEEIEI